MALRLKASAVTGRLDPKDFPATSFMNAEKIAEESGRPTADPRELSKAAFSRENQNRLRNVEDRQIERISRFDPQPINIDSSPIERAKQLAERKRDVEVRESKGRSLILARGQRLSQEMAELSRLDKEARKKLRTAKEGATEDLDSQINDIMSERLTARSQLRSQLSHLSPSQRSQVLSAQDSMFRTRINNLNKIRQIRLGALDDAFEKEEAAIEDDIDVMNDRINALKLTKESLESSGASARARVQIDEELSKELERLRKKRKAGNAALTSEELFEAIISKEEREGRGELTSDEKEAIKQRANVEGARFKARTGLTDFDIEQGLKIERVGGAALTARGVSASEQLKDAKSRAELVKGGLLSPEDAGLTAEQARRLILPKSQGGSS